MKTSKKILEILVTLLMIMSVMLLPACGSRNSGLTIDALQQIFAETDDELFFTKTQTSTGYSFTYTTDSFVFNSTYNGKADTGENVTSISITNENVEEASTLSNVSALKKIMTKNGNDMTMIDLRLSGCVLQVIQLRKACGADDGNMDLGNIVDEVADLFTAGSRPMIVGDWTISATISGQTVTITATYF